MEEKQRFVIVCPYCGQKQYAQKSIFHEMGIADGGIGSCLQCDAVMQLVFDDKRQEMKAEKMERRIP